MSEVVMFVKDKNQIEARIYRNNGTYFKGTGSSDAEALGSLIFHYGPEQLGLKVRIILDPDELT